MIFVIVTGKQQECDYELMICCYLHLVSMTVVVCVQWVIAEMIAQALATVLMLVSMHWFVFLLNFPVASWSVYRWFSPITPHTADTPLQLTVPDVCEQIREGSHGEHGSVRSHRDPQQRPAQVPHEGSHGQTGLPPAVLLHLPVQVKPVWSPRLCCS